MNVLLAYVHHRRVARLSAHSVKRALACRRSCRRNAESPVKVSRDTGIEAREFISVPMF